MRIAMGFGYGFMLGGGGGGGDKLKKLNYNYFKDNLQNMFFICARDRYILYMDMDVANTSKSVC